LDTTKKLRGFQSAVLDVKDYHIFVEHIESIETPLDSTPRYEIFQQVLEV